MFFPNDFIVKGLLNFIGGEAGGDDGGRPGGGGAGRGRGQREAQGRGSESTIGCNRDGRGGGQLAEAAN